MQTKLKQEPSTVIQFNKSNILVATLPSGLQNEIFTLDRYLQDTIDLTYEVEKIQLAIHIKRNQINSMLEKHLSSSETELETADPDTTQD